MDGPIAGVGAAVTREQVSHEARVVDCKGDVAAPGGFRRGARKARFRGRPPCSRSCGALLPFALEAASDQAVVGIDGTVAALGAARFVACPLDAEAPLPERGLAIGLEPARGGDSGGELCRLEGGEEGPRDDLVDLDAADVEAIDAAARS